MQAIGPVETKLLYTMQWILLYAAEECADDEDGDELGLAEAAEPKAKPMDQYLFSVPTITVSSCPYEYFLAFQDSSIDFLDIVICVLVCAHYTSSEGVGFSKLSPREWHQVVAGHVGQSCTWCPMLHCARKAQGTELAVCTNTKGFHGCLSGSQAFSWTGCHVTQGGLTTEWHHRLWSAG